MTKICILPDPDIFAFDIIPGLLIVFIYARQICLGLEVACDASLCMVGALRYAATHDKFLSSYVFRFPHDKLRFA